MKKIVAKEEESDSEGIKQLQEQMLKAQASSTPGQGNESNTWTNCVVTKLD